MDGATELGEADWGGRRVLVTGGAGFIGSNLARRLCGFGAAVTCLDAFVATDGANDFNFEGFRDRVQVIRGDLRDANVVAQVVSGHEFLFNLAAQTSHVESMRDPRADLEVNALAQLQLVETCRRLTPGIRIVHVSTRQVYGPPRALPVDETHPLAPPDVNAINKISGEFYHLLYGHIYGLRPTVLRLTNVYGPRMRTRDARQMFLGWWINCACSRIPFEVWGGSQIRDLSFVDNVVDAILAATADQAIGRVFNIGGEISLTLRELADRLVSVQEGASYVVKDFPADRKLIDVGDYRADDTAFRAAVGWRPRVGFDEALATTLDFYRLHGRHYFGAPS